MNRPLLAFDKFEPTTLTPDKRKADVVPIKPGIGRLMESLAVSSPAVELGNFRSADDRRDTKIIDYLLLVVLSLLVHSAVVDYFKRSSVEKEERVEPVKPPSKVQISFVRPQPKPVVQPPPPPPPKVVALKKPPKPKVQPKPAPKVEPPPPAPTPTAVQADAPVVSAPPAPPAPPVVEKVTEPRAGAGYLDNPAPVYPEVAMERGWEGKVLMKVHVQANGKPDNVSVVKSSGKEVLDDEAVRTVKQWSFVPAMRGTTPVDGWVTVPISFNLQS
ncbi:MAG: energy transducer TonB [Methylobacter sp.]|nr:energy transducer TonB [Methylobacter sp.]